jgi:amidase
MVTRFRHLPPEPWRWDAVDLAEAIRLGVLSSREATESCLDRLNAVNPTLNAVVAVLGEEALAAADAADHGRRRGAALGPLHGVPVTIKDNVDQAGQATVDGVPGGRERIAAIDSPVVANWRRAGAVILGRTNTPSFSARWDTDNDVFGRSWNPWSRARTAGGSSGGAAGALACGIGPLAHGNDLGGSIRYPAFCCGVAGLRPTQGRVPSYNPSAAEEGGPAGPLISVNGLLARRVRDLRLGLGPLAAGDAHDPGWVPAPLQGPPPERPIRVALVTEAPGLHVHPAIEHALRQAASVLAEAGYQVEAVATPSIAEAAAIWAAIGSTDTRHLGWPVLDRFADEGVKQVNRLFMDAVPPVDLAGYLRTLSAMRRERRAWSVFLERYPLLLGPNSGDLAFPIGFDTRDLDAMRHQLQMQALMVAVNLLGLPAVAVPTGTAAVEDAPAGLPIGVQLVAGRFREDLALDAAEVIEARLGLATPIDPVA